jgi:hypothetical protein
VCDEQWEMLWHSQEKLDCAAGPATLENSSKVEHHLDVETRIPSSILLCSSHFYKKVISCMVDKTKSYYANFDLYVLSSTMFILVIYLLNRSNQVFCTEMKFLY